MRSCNVITSKIRLINKKLFEYFFKIPLASLDAFSALEEFSGTLCFTDFSSYNPLRISTYKVI